MLFAANKNPEGKMNGEYIKELTNEEKIVFVKIFCRMIKSDGDINTEEVKFLKEIAKYFGVSGDAVVNIIKIANNIDCAAEARKITNRKHALQLIKELCVLANIDEDLHDNELDIVVDCAEAMGIEEEKVILINRWVLDSQIVAQTGKIILEED